MPGLFFIPDVLAPVPTCGGDRSGRPVVTRTDEGASSAPAGAEVAARGRSLVRLVNAMPAARNIDVSGDDRTLFADVAYRDVTPYAEVTGNLVTVRLRTAGGDSVLADNHEMLADGHRYTIVALPDPKGDPELRILKDELAPDPAVTRLRVINAAEGLGAEDLTLSGRKEPLFAYLHLMDSHYTLSPLGKDLPRRQRFLRNLYAVDVQLRQLIKTLNDRRLLAVYGFWDYRDSL